MKNKKFAWIFGATTLWALVCASVLGLTDQEAYYWTWSRVLDWCYFEHPGLQAWSTALISQFFGNTAFAIRLPAFLIGRVAATWFFWKWCQLRFVDKRAELAMWVFFATFFVIVSSVIALPDAYMFPFICMTLYFSEKQNSWAAGLSLGLTGLAKWTGALIAPGALVAFLYDSRKPLKKRLLNGAVLTLVSLALQAPTFYWNAKNQWGSFKFHLVDRQPNFSWGLMPTLKNAMSFAFSQWILGGVGIWILLFYWIRKRKHSSPDQAPNKMPLWPWILPAFLLIGFSGLRGELRFYWTAPAFLPLIVAVMQRLSFDAAEAHRFEKTLTTSIYVSLALFSALVFFPIGELFRPLIESYRDYDIRFSPRGDVEGWREVFSDIRAEGLFKDPSKVALMASDFRLSSQVAWASGIQDMGQIYVASGLQNQFAYWESMRKSHPTPEALFFRDNRYMSRAGFSEHCRGSFDWKTFEYKQMNHVVKVIHWAHCPDFRP